MSITIKHGGIAEAVEQYIIHQTNCLSTYAKGLAKHLFECYPGADVYSSRKQLLSNSKSDSNQEPVTINTNPNIGDMLSSRAGKKACIVVNRYSANSDDIPGTIVVRGKLSI